MQVGLYVIYDDVAKESGPIFEAKNEEVAIRKIVDVVITNRLNPDSYLLLIVGEFDTESAVITQSITADIIDYMPFLQAELNRLDAKSSDKFDKVRKMFDNAQGKKEVVNE